MSQVQDPELLHARPDPYDTRLYLELTSINRMQPIIIKGMSTALSKYFMESTLNNDARWNDDVHVHVWLHVKERQAGEESREGTKKKTSRKEEEVGVVYTHKVMGQILY